MYLDVHMYFQVMFHNSELCVFGNNKINIKVIFKEMNNDKVVPENQLHPLYEYHVNIHVEHCFSRSNCSCYCYNISRLHCWRLFEINTMSI